MRSDSYCARILAGVSPIVTLDADGLIRFASLSFLKEFELNKAEVEKREFVRVMKMPAREARVFKSRLSSFKGEPLQNCEVKIGRRIFGYSIFSVGEDRGIILKDITEIKELEKRVRALNSRLRDLQEKERQRIASELHDSIGQTILAAKINLQAGVGSEIAKADRFNTGMELIDRASQELRDIYTSLYPSTLKDLGLEATIQWYLRNFVEVKGIHTIFSITLSKKIPHETEVGIFRMIQEITTNIVKHSGARTVFFSLLTGKHGLLLMVYDDGVGFSSGGLRKKGSGYGLENLKSRADDLGGQLQIESEPGCGTWVEVKLPLLTTGRKKR